MNKLKISEDKNNNKINRSGYSNVVDSNSIFCSNDCDKKKIDSYDRAIQLKNKGNSYFKEGVYSLALNMYEKALFVEAEDNVLNSILYTNKAACHYHQAQYEMCIEDCKEAIKLNNKHSKAYWRAVAAADKSDELDEGLSFCDDAIKAQIDNNEINNLREKLMERKKKENESNMIIENELKNRGVVFVEGTSLLKIQKLFLRQTMMDKYGNIYFNVVILYPEYNQNDIIQDVMEKASLMSCLKRLFLVNKKKVDWDIKGHYKLYEDGGKVALRTYYSNCDGEMTQVALNMTIGSLINLEEFRMRADFAIVLYVVPNLSVEFLNKWDNGTKHQDLL